MKSTRTAAQHEIAALEARLEAMELVRRAAQKFVDMRFPPGIAGQDDRGHPLSYEGVARQDLRRAIAAAQQEKEDE